MYNLANILKIPELWTTSKCVRIIAQTKVRGVLKCSWQLLLNGVKQKILKFVLIVWSRLKVDKFSNFRGKISQKSLQRNCFRAPRIFLPKMRSCCYMTKRYVKWFGQQLQNKRVREWYVPSIFGHSEVENVGHLWSENKNS